MEKSRWGNSPWKLGRSLSIKRSKCLPSTLSASESQSRASPGGVLSSARSRVLCGAAPHAAFVPALRSLRGTASTMGCCPLSPALAALGKAGGGGVPLGPWADYGGGARAVAKSGRRRPRCLRRDLPSCPSTGEAPAGDERLPPAQQPGTAAEPQPAPRRLRGKRIGSRKHVSK